ncbi:GAF and ANTAR domain-containing protein [Nocardiopsis sp. HNM0947]|uniref:GAF and ANTAR domain-containing protein n=1 Tax=Nocardiopsis coralli TaxID=2772213 RepID=A0ABR9P384_9ACTN|nr:GAF and ANTAR domain-containing protein [Nocardiopsis coralli]MBE2998316.1 GAF and ANTAR domain-containing protein [Nocardiopsis coralli]
MTSAAQKTADAFADVARNLLDRGSVQATLEEISDLAASEVGGCEFAGISLVGGDGTISTPVATDPLVEHADQLQYTTGQGPCLETIHDRQVYVVDDVRQDGRWPVFAAEVAGLGVRSMMSHQLYTRREVLGCLNLYSTELNAFDRGSVEIGQVLAAHAAVALASAQNDARLRDAMQTRSRIGEATGILMERYKVPGDQAFALLVKASQNLNTKLRELAEVLVETGALPRGSSGPDRQG